MLKVRDNIFQHVSWRDIRRVSIRLEIERRPEGEGQAQWQVKQKCGRCRICIIDNAMVTMLLKTMGIS